MLVVSEICYLTMYAYFSDSEWSSITLSHAATCHAGSGETSKPKFKFLHSADEAAAAIRGVLSADPRSIYRRNRCRDRLFFFTLDTAHITCWFGEGFAEVLQVRTLPQRDAVEASLLMGQDLAGNESWTFPCSQLSNIIMLLSIFKNQRYKLEYISTAYASIDMIFFPSQANYSFTGHECFKCWNCCMYPYTIVLAKIISIIECS